MKTYQRRHTGSEKIENLSQLCRLCLNTHPEMVRIFSSDEDIHYEKLALRIRICAGIEVIKDKITPQAICRPCYNEIDKIYSFRKKCDSVNRRIKLHTLALYEKKQYSVRKQEPCQKKAPKIERKGILCPAPNKECVNNKITPDRKQMSEIIVGKLTETGVMQKENDGLALVNKNMEIQNIHLEISTSDYGTISFELMEESEEEKPVIAPKTSITRTPRKNVKKKKLKRVGCDICTKTFVSRNAMLRHKRVHTGEKPFCCPLCEKSFAQKEVLTRHELVHLEEKPHVCDICGRSFTQRAALQSHSRSHKSPQCRPLQLHTCWICNRVFLYASGLRRHILVEHLGRSYQCEKCPRKFSDTSAYSRHMRQVHPETPLETGPSDKNQNAEISKELDPNVNSDLHAALQTINANDLTLTPIVEKSPFENVMEPAMPPTEF